MMIELAMGRDFKRTVTELGGMGTAMTQACSVGLSKGVKIAAGHVVKNYLSGQAIKRRTGQLSRSVDGWMARSLEGVVGVIRDAATAKYAWLLGDERKTIRPVRAKFLTIPIGENLTSSGAARFSSPRQMPEGFFVRSKKGLFFGYKRGKRGKFRPMFSLRKSVTITGSNALYDGVLDSVDKISDSIEAEISKQTGGD